MKRLAFLAMAATAGGMWAVMVACSSDAGSTFGEGLDSSFEASALGFGDGGVPDSGPVTCTTALPVDFAPEYLAPGLPAGQCTTEELGAYFDACFASTGGVVACDAWRQAHAGCTACIQPEAGTGPVQTFVDNKYLQVNLGGCYALEQGVAANGNACAQAQQGSDECQIASCLPCIGKDGVTNEAISGCKTKAKSGGCASYVSGVGTACPLGYTGPDGGAYDCYPHGTEQTSDPRTWITRVLGVYCGAPN